MHCVLTRIRMKHAWQLLPSFILFRRLQRRSIPGLQRSAFVVESPWVFHTVSLWQDARAILEFGGQQDHVAMVRWTFPRATEIWSAEFVVLGRSPRQQWHQSIVGVDVRSAADEALA